MEKGATISDNKLLLSSNSDDVVRLMKQKLHHHHHHRDEQVFPSKIWMDTHRHRPVDDGGANEAAVLGRDDPLSSSSSSTYARRSCTNSQPFDILAPSYPTAPYKSLGEGGMAAAAAFPFTCAQWKELERQAMIYKYMISSVPVPPNLLFPLSTTTDNYSPSSSLVYNGGGGYSKNGDLEPGRCKRTDGKKWRCSREVAPGHKYCERHLHRGRPRSRKPVELAKNDAVLLPNKKTRLQQHTHLPIPTPTTSLRLSASATTTTTLPKSDPTISSYKGFNRDMGFGFSNEGSSIYGSTPIFHQDYYMDQLQLNMLPYNPNMEIGSGFIDAWSTDNLNTNNQNNSGNNEYSLSWMNRGDFSPSLDLSIAMAAGNFIDSEMGNVRMGADHEENTIKDSNSSMPSPVFWEPFGRGGPLAEALQVTSPHECSIGTPATTVSSPSGVVYNNNNNSNSRTLFSQSDGSVCNSPTFAVPTSEVGYHRFS